MIDTCTAINSAISMRLSLTNSLVCTQAHYISPFVSLLCWSQDLKGMCASALPSPSIPAHCSDIKKKNSSATSGTYQINPSGSKDAGSLISVYCDMSGQTGWTKVLQIAETYSVTPSAFGDVTMGSTFSTSGKLSDSTINAITGSLRRSSSTGNVFYRLTSTDTTYQVYVRNPKVFNDTARSWNIFRGARHQCYINGPSFTGVDTCPWFLSTHHSLDTLHDGSNSGEKNRFWTYWGNSGEPYCWKPRLRGRCVSEGVSCYHCQRQGVQLWVGN